MSEELWKLLPRLKRARDFYLYDEKGNRYLDLYLDNGRALCGHRPNGLSNSLKNAISRGIYAPYPSVYEGRLVKGLQKGFPSYSHWGIYKSLESFRSAVGGEIAICDPSTGGTGGAASLWRPFLPVDEQSGMIIVSFPYPGVDAVAVGAKDGQLPPSDRISSVVQAGLVRSWYDLQARLVKGEEPDWSLLDHTGHWKRRGPYLQPLCSREDYGGLFRLYLDSGIIISPEFDCPSICAVDIKEGSLKRLNRALKENRDG